MVDEFAGSEFGQPKGWPRASARGESHGRDEQRAGTHGQIPRATFLERWQSGRMRRIRNPVYGHTVTWVRIPPSPPETKTPLVGVLRFWGQGGVDEPAGSTNLSGTNSDAEGGPERSEGRASGTMRAIPPSPPHTTKGPNGPFAFPERERRSDRHRLHPTSRNFFPTCRSVFELRWLPRTSSRTSSHWKRRAIAYKVSPRRTV